MWISVILLCVAIVPGCAHPNSTASPTSSSAAHGALSARIDAFLAPYVAEGYWSGAVVMVQGDSVLHRAGYGMANLAHQVPNTPETRFQIASVTKVFTAVAAARLWEAGVIEREGTIDRWIPDFPRGDEITVAHLLGHRSGIPDTDDLPWFEHAQARPHGITVLVDSLGAAGLEFDPGDGYSYSNGGYTVLAAVLANATDLEYHEVLQRWVFDPAGMVDSGDAGLRGVVPDLAEGYMPGPTGALVPGPAVHPSNKIGAGSAFTTVDDVAAFYRALSDDRLLSPALRDSLFDTIDSALGEPRLYFGGRGPSHTAAIQIYPDRDLLVAALGNNYARLNEEVTDGLVGLVVGEWKDQRVDAILGRELPFRSVAVDGAALDALTGEYQHQWGFTFALEREGDQLVYVDPEHGTRSPMIALLDGVFVSPWQWAELRLGDTPGFLWLDFPDRVWDLERLEREASVR